jgi:hypothetical protein
MDTSRWNVGAEFPILDLVARFLFKSTSSMSFDLGAERNLADLLPDAGSWVDLGKAFAIEGWLDIHHPCEGFYRLQIRVGLTDRYVSWESMQEVAKCVIAVLELPADESYHIYLAGVSQATSAWWPQTEFVSTTKWKPPG